MGFAIREYIYAHTSVSEINYMNLLILHMLQKISIRKGGSSEHAGAEEKHIGSEIRGMIGRDADR